jgi:hypothetical protein
MQPGFQK